MSTTEDRVKQLVNEMIRARATASAASREAGEMLKLYEKEVEARQDADKALAEAKAALDDARKELAKASANAAAWQTEVQALVNAGFEPGELEGPEKLRELMQSWTAKARELDEEADEILGTTGDKHVDALSSEAATYRTCAGALSRFLRAEDKWARQALHGKIVGEGGDDA